MHGTLRLENDGTGNCYGQYSTIRVEGVPLALREQVIREFSYGFQNCRTLFTPDEIDKVLVAIGFTKKGHDVYGWTGVPIAAPEVTEADADAVVSAETVDAPEDEDNEATDDEAESDAGDPEDPTSDVPSPDEAAEAGDAEAGDAEAGDAEAGDAEAGDAELLDALAASLSESKKKGKR